MKTLLVKLLSVLLIAVLLCPAVIAEKISKPEINISEDSMFPTDLNSEINEHKEETEYVDVPEEVLADSVDAIVEEQSVDLEDESLSVMSKEEYPGALTEEDYKADSENVSFSTEMDGSVIINKANFPDDYFRTYITTSLFNKNDGDTLTAEELASVTEIYAPSEATDLTGIMWFSNLKTLAYHPSQASILDVSGHTNLEVFSSGYSQLTDLNLSGCTKLKSVYCCAQSQLTSLNVSGCTNLNSLICNYCKLEILNVDGCMNLQQLDCTSNHLTILNIGGFTKLERLYCSYNYLTNLNVSGFTNLRSFHCVDNHLTSLDVSGCTELWELPCNDNQLTNLNVSGCTNLENLICYHNQLVSLDVSDCPHLVRCIKEGKKRDHDEDGISCMSYSYNDEEYLNTDPNLTIIYEKNDINATSATDPASSTSSVLTNPTTLNATKKITKAILQVGKQYQIDLAGKTGKKYKSSRKKVATVTSTGLITPKSAGKAIITFKVGKKTRKIKLTVKDPTVPSSVSLNMSGTQTTKKGESVNLTATLPEGTNSVIKWKSSNKKVATVNAQGVVTFKKKGKVTIICTAKRGGKKAKVKFKVTE